MIDQHKLNMMSALFSPVSTIGSNNMNLDDNFSSINGDFLGTQSNYKVNSNGAGIGSISKQM